MLALALRGRPRQPARDMALVAALRAPQRLGRATNKGEPVTDMLVRVWEAVAETRLEWLLLTEQPLSQLTQGLTVVRQYTSRWLIENFHKALKTGLGAERLQLQTAARLFAAVALLSVVALVKLRERSRQQPEVSAVTVGLVGQLLAGAKKLAQTAPNNGARRVLRLSRAGRHLERMDDEPPGWQTHWVGLISLR